MSATTTLSLPLLPSLAGALEKPRERPHPAEVLSDRALLERVVQGDQDAFAVLYRRYERPVFGVLLRIAGRRALAEELLQEAFTRVWLGAASHDPGRGEVKPWVYTIALNTARSEMARKRHRTTHLSIDDLELDFPCGGEGELSELLDEERRAARLALALRELPDFMQEVVALRCSRELSFAEISQITGAPEGTLKARFHRAVAALRKKIAAQDGGRL